MVRALAALSNDSNRLQYHLFVADAHRQALPPVPGPNFTWHPTRLNERWLTRLWYRLQLPLPVELWTGQLDLFHAPDFFLPPVQSQTKTVVTIFDLSFVRQPETVMPGMIRHLSTWVPRSVAKADHIIAISEATRQDLIELYQTPPAKISVLYPGVTPDFQPVSDPQQLTAVRRKYGLREGPFILSVGTLQPRKNYQRLIQALAQAAGATSASPLSLVIVGSKGWQYESIFSEVTRLGLEQRVQFLGFVEDSDLPALYSAASVFAYPSLYEGFGLPILEAMACGVPVIASNQSAMPEVVGQAGLLINPYHVDELAAAITRLLSEANLRQQFKQAGLAQAAQFTWLSMAAKLLALYQKLIEG
jgi:glycosyltransferase involved in cell wall biosynthesis